MDMLEARWKRLMARLEIVDPINATPNEILKAYAEPHRQYHTQAHLLHCFEVLDDLAPAAPPLIEYALWFHDFVYDTQGTENEEQSALAAKERCNRFGLGPAATQLVTQLILATKHNAVPELPEAKIIVDVDLAILGESEERFDAYENQIRQEYAWVPEEGYKAGRTKVLRGFLDREWIYSTPGMRQMGYEGRAQENLRRSLARL